MPTWISISKARFKEWLLFDSILLASVVRFCVGVSGLLLYYSGSRKWSFRLMSAVHGAGKPRQLCGAIEGVMRQALRADRSPAREGFDRYFRSHIETSPQRALPVIAKEPQRMIKNLAIVVASPQPSGARGVIILNYNHIFPHFAREFDVRRIAERYHLVLEASWSGYCVEDVLCYTLLRPNTVFVQGYEKHDADFIDAIGTNLVNVPLSTNWWVDWRVFSPDPEIERDLDFVMVASWADFKRHHRFFRALQKLRRNGHRLRGACVGYPAGLTLEEIQRRARWYGVADQIEFHEFIPQTEVAALMKRAKANVVWSRKEGVNRVIIEGMFCDVPCLLPEGFNYGYRYGYVNDETGRFSTDRNLPRDLLEMTREPWPHSPASWVRRHMTPQQSTEILAQAIGRHCAEIGEEPPERLAVKVDGLSAMEYWDRDDESSFAPDYEFLREQMVGTAPKRRPLVLNA